MHTWIRIVLLLPLAALVNAAQTNSAPPQAAGVAEHRRELLQRVMQNPSATGPTAARHGYVPTNTLAFREYSLDLLIALANEVAEKWNLELSRPVTADHVTRFYAVPRITGADATITINERFGFAIQEGRFERFRDLRYWSGSWGDNSGLPTAASPPTNSELRAPIARDEAFKQAFLGQAGRANAHHQKMVELSRATNRLTKETAMQLAQRCFHKLGFTEKQLGLCEQPDVTQFKYQPEGGTNSFPLPLYGVAWRFQGNDLEPVTMEVSGITGSVVSYFNVAPGAKVIAFPTNYFEMLGVPPEPRLWGKQYGYDPINTEAFQAFARDVLVEKANWLNQTWKLGLAGTITSNHVERFQAIPHTNTFLASGQVANRFQFQVGDGMIQIFKDDKQASDAFTGHKEKMMELLKQKNQLTKSSALALAREALAQIALDEKRLRLPKPRVSQVREPFPGEEKLRDLPFFSIEWKWTNNEEEYPAMAMELSGITEKVTFFANSYTNTPRFALPSNYHTILGLK